jgi:hypothetical protein
MVSCLLAWCESWRPHNQPPGWLTDDGLKDSIAPSLVQWLTPWVRYHTTSRVNDIHFFRLP